MTGTTGCRSSSSSRADITDAPEQQAQAPDVSDLLDKPLYTFDESDVDRYLRALPAIEPDLHKRIIRLGRQNIGQPYDIYLLGEFPYEAYDPDPIYCLNKSDCVVFSEHMYSMALSHDWWTFLQTLQRIRYKDGAIGMLTRNHYGLGDWNPNNAFLFDDLTKQVGSGEVAVPLTQVCRRSRFFAKFGIGEDIPDQPISDWYIPKERIPDVQHEFRDADMVNIIRGNDESQWCGHVGLIAIAEDGTVDFLHSAGKAVREQPLVEYVNGDKNCRGIKVLRLKPDAERIMADTLANSPTATRITEETLNAGVAARRNDSPIDVRYPARDWREAMHLQEYRINDDTPTDVQLQQALVRLDARVAQRHDIPEGDRAFGVLSLTDLRLALIHPDAMFYAASVPKICILLAYFDQHPESARALPDDVRHELERMIKLSDNALAAKYGNIVGIEKTQELLQSKRYQFYDQEKQTGLWYGKHYAQGSPRFGDPVHDYSHGATVRQCLRFYLMMEQGNLVNAEASLRMREIFAAPSLEHHNGNFVKGLQGRDLSIIRKSGGWEDWHLDTARVDHGDQVYVIVGMTHHANGSAYLEEMAAGIDDLLCGKPVARKMRHEHVAHDKLNALIEVPPANENTPAGAYESPVITSNVLFNQALLSWNIDAPPHVGYSVEARVGRQRDDSWTDWLRIADRGTLQPQPVAGTASGAMYIDTDYLWSEERYDRLQYRVRAVCGPIPNSPATAYAKLRIARVDVTFTDTSDLLTSLPAPSAPASPPEERWQRRLPVPFRSQKAEREAIRGKICSPTSVSMVLAYRGVDRPTEEIAETIYDHTNGIYGNWPRAVQEAYSYGVPGYLDRFADWSRVEALIAQDQPLIISIEAKDGELPGAPYKSTEGHLLVLVGFDQDGNVLVNDPASPTPEQGMIAYTRADLENVWWLPRSGTAYILQAPPALNATNAPVDSADDPLVEVADVDPRIMIDLRYATSENFTGKTLYPADLRCQLRKSVAERLHHAQERLVRRGLGLKIYDGFRPLSVQRTMWEIMPDSRYVANPARGSRHNRGAAVDVTLVDRAGHELEMPTPYDDFTEAAHRDYTGGSAESLVNRELLSDVMTMEGFTGLATEWWHFDAPHWDEYALIEESEPAAGTAHGN
ncbi:MAG: DUF1460 domain-containing protein [Phycisphaerales bacterium]|nr:DUF1460 domain-containing protein [Phycisphaerales bacterium]